MMNDDRSFTSSTERERARARDPRAESRDKGVRLDCNSVTKFLEFKNSEFIGGNWEMSRQNVRNVLKAKIKFK